MKTAASLAFAALTWAPLSSFAQLYSIEVIGPINSLNTEATAINNPGNVLGTFGGEIPDNFISSGGNINVLGNLGGAFPSIHGLNDAGDFAGQYQHNGNYHAFVSISGVVTDLGSLGGNQFSGATDINNADQVVGSTSTNTSQQRAFLYSGGVMNELGTLGGAVSGAAAINGLGDVAGFSSMVSGAYHAFYYSGGLMSDLGTLGGKDSFSNDVNNLGQVVGFSNFSLASDVKDHAFFHDSNGIHDLGTLGGESSWANAINDAGLIVGGSQTGQAVHAFLFHGQTMTDLNSLVDLTNTGLVDLDTAVDINESGQITGTARRTDGMMVAYVLTPLNAMSAVPEPSTFGVAAGLLLVALGLRRMKRNRDDVPTI